MTGTSTEYRVSVSNDFGQTWSPFVSAAGQDAARGQQPDQSPRWSIPAKGCLR